MQQHYSVSRGHRNLLVTAGVAAFLLISMGGVVCSTNSSGGCPDWPQCHGRLVPPLQMNSLIEYTHRAVALVTAILAVAATVLGFRRRSSGVALRLLPATSVGLIIVVAVFGAFAVLTGLPPLLAAIDLGSALVVLTLMVATAATASIRFSQPEVDDSSSVHSPLWKLSVSTLASFFVVIVSGVFVARGSVMRCVGGPLHLGTWSSIGSSSWDFSIRQLLGTISALLLFTVVVTAFRDATIDSGTRRWCGLLGVVFLIEGALNAAMVSAGATPALLVASAVAAAGSWSVLVVVCVRARMLAAAPAESAATLALSS